MYCTLALMSSCNQILQGARLDHLHVNLVNFKLVRYILFSFSCIAIAEVSNIVVVTSQCNSFQICQ